MTITHVHATDCLGSIIQFDVDFAAGQIVGEPIGEHAGIDLGILDGYQGEIHFPQQQSFAAPHPLADPQSMAWYLMSRGYQDIQGELAKYPPPPFDDLPDGAIA